MKNAMLICCLNLRTSSKSNNVWRLFLLKCFTIKKYSKMPKNSQLELQMPDACLLARISDNQLLPTVNCHSRWDEILGNKQDEMSDEIRRKRWEEWKDLASKDGKRGREAVEYWCVEGPNESCSGCKKRDDDWCLSMQLPCSVNPILTIKEGIIGMACMGTGYERSEEENTETEFTAIKDDEPEILSMFMEMDWSVYEEGRQACLSGSSGNPYKKNTNKFYNWNKGWNAVD